MIQETPNLLDRGVICDSSADNICQKVLSVHNQSLRFAVINNHKSNILLLKHLHHSSKKNFIYLDVLEGKVSMLRRVWVAQNQKHYI